MRTTKTMTISMPPDMAVEISQMKKEGNFTTSELIRHALRQFFYSQFPVYKPTQPEIRAIEAGRREIARGNFITLEELHAKLDRKNGKKSRKAL